MGIGVILMVSAAGPLLAASSGLTKLVSGLVFGTALTLTVFGGAELATSAMMILPLGVLMRAVTTSKATLALVFIFVANLVGAGVFSLIVFATGLASPSTPAGAMLSDMLTAKGAETPLELFTRGILCNVLVCLAIWMASRVQDPLAKIALIFISITAFITSGFEHVIANMTTYTLGMLLGDSHATLPLFASNLLWVGLGNLVGGALAVGLPYWFIGGSPTTNRIQAPAKAA